MNRFVSIHVALGLAFWLFAFPVCAGDLIVRDGAQLELHSSTLNLNCGDISVTSGGNVDLGTGTVMGSRNMEADASSTLTLGSATVNLCATPAPPLPTTASLVVNTEPDSIAPPWELTGPETRTGSGDQTLIDLPEGTYTLTWGEAPPGWVGPFATTHSLALPAGVTAARTGQYKALDTDDDGIPDSMDTGDSDADGLSDAWETTHLLNPALNQGIMDQDRDGYSDLREGLAGTDATDASSTPSPAAVFVKPDGNGTGTSWSDAFGNLQTAIYYAAPGEKVWVQAGTYLPKQAPNYERIPPSREVVWNVETGASEVVEHAPPAEDQRTRHFALKPGITLCGGFKGTETSLDQRDIVANLTVLSGDLEKNDDPDIEATLDDNLYHVIYHPEGETPWEDIATLDGVTISGGNADKTAPESDPGAYIPAEYLQGGGLYLDDGRFRLIRCRIENNRAKEGGGIFVGDADAELISSILAKNTATTDGGGYYNSGARSQTLRSCTVTANNAGQSGGGVYAGIRTVTLTFDSSLFWNNTASTPSHADAGWAAPYGTPVSWFSCRDSSSGAPLFMDPAIGDYTLQSGSPAIDAGNPDATPRLFGTTDFGGNPRLDGQLDIGAFEYPTSAALTLGGDEDGDGLTNAKELEAGLNPRLSDTDHDGMPDSYEVFNGLDGLSDDRWKDADGDGFANIRESDEGTAANNPDDTPTLNATWYVKQNAPATNDGKSWASAWGDPQRAIFYAGPGDAVWIEKGSYVPTWAPNLPGTTDPRNNHFSLKKGVAVHGGFKGYETSLEERVIDTRPMGQTIFSGEIQLGLKTDNIRHIFYHPPKLGLDTTATLDRVTISGGYTNGQGGGMLNLSASPTLTFCRIEKNHASLGGGLHNDNSSPKLMQCLVTGNETIAISNRNASRPELVNTTLAANVGGIDNDASSSVRLENTIVWDNGSGPQVSDSGSVSEVLWSLVGEPEASPSSDPLFTNPVPVYGDFTLKDASPAIHAGNPAATTAGIGTSDLAGASRFCGPIDMGAFENHTTDTDCDGIKEADKDSDGDGLPDIYETTQGTDPAKADTDGNGIPDGQEDSDNDGLTVLEEFGAGTDTTLADTDGDGLNDGIEVTEGLNPTEKDRWADTDGDGFSNGRELMEGTWANDKTSHPAKRTVFVDADASGAENGSSWVHAFANLQTAIYFAAPGEEIWVADGTYVPSESPHLPDNTDPRGYHFTLKAGVSVYGGFKGTETQRSQSNSEANTTRLSGDQGGGTYSNHVVWYRGSGSAEAILDGVTLTGGDGTSPIADPAAGYGGGLRNEGILRLSRCKIIHNKAFYGGGIHAARGTLTIANSLITDNEALISGGGIQADSGYCELKFSTVIGNTSPQGTALYIDNTGGLESIITHTIAWGTFAYSDSVNPDYPHNAADISHSCVLEETPTKVDDSGNINYYPNFGDDFRLAQDSPCRNAGATDATEAETGESDLAGNPRRLCRVDIGAYEYQEEVDSDGDGTPNCDDAFPNAGGESVDTDGDGVGDTTDLDDDNDGMPDAWEIARGLNPLSPDDAGLDPDGDGTSNLQEYATGTNPGNNTDYPARAVRTLPADGDVTGHAPVLTARYGGGTVMGTHTRSRWQIATESSFAHPVMDLTIDTPLMQLGVPGLTLEPNTRYCWRVRFEDAAGLWSDTGWFTTEAQGVQDSNYNGIPDAQETCRTAEAPDVLCLPELPVKVTLKDTTDLRQMEEITLLEPEKITDDRNVPTLRPTWMLGFQAEVDSPGETVTLTFASDTPIPDDVVWAKYDAAKGWQDFSSKVTLDTTRTLITLTVTDGGPGDADGVANGVIVDPFGPSEGEFPVDPPEPTYPPEPTDPPEVKPSSGSSSGYGACFINSL